MEKKKSFILYLDSLNVFEDLTKEQIADLFIAIRDFHLGKELKLKGLMKAVFKPFENQFKRDLEKYEKVIKKRKEAGSKGGKAKASKSKQSLANLAVNDNVNDNVISSSKEEEAKPQ